MSSNTLRAAGGATLRSLLSVGLDFSSDLAGRRSKLWRLYGHLLLKEIGQRHEENPDAPDSSLYVAYEQNLSGVAEHLVRLQNVMAQKGIFRHLMNSNWLDTLLVENPQHHVMVTSLFRRLRDEDNIYRSIRNRPGLLQRAKGLDVQRQHEVLANWDKAEDSDNKQLPAWISLIMFPSTLLELPKILKNRFAEKPRAGKQKPEILDPVNFSEQPLTLVTSQSQVKAEGWYQENKGASFRVSEALRNRNYYGAVKMCETSGIVNALSQAELRKLIALRSLLNIPTLSDSLLGDVVSRDRQIVALMDKNDNTQRERVIASAILSSKRGISNMDPIRKLWLEAEDLVKNEDNHLDVVGILQDIAVLYGDISINRVTKRRLSYDTFLVTRLDTLLDKAKDWLDWHNEKASVVLAFTHCAVLSKHHELSRILFRIIDGKSGFKSPAKLALSEAYLGTGLHSLAAFMVGDLEGLVKGGMLTQLSPKEKVLCLVEPTASINSFTALKGLSKNVVCAPVQPADALSFPENVQKIQIEDHIAMYSQEDMEISAEVDRLTSLAVSAVTSKFTANNATHEWADFIEITHANVFFGLYRNVMSVKLVEKLVNDLKAYDKVVFLLKDGLSLSAFFKPVIEKIGAENVFFSVEAAKKVNQTKAIMAVRAIK